MVFIYGILFILFKPIGNNPTSIIKISLMNNNSNSSYNKSNEKSLDSINNLENNQMQNSISFKSNEIINSSKYKNNNLDINKKSNYNKKNLLIGAIEKYMWEDVALFFKSYMRAGFNNCDCVMFIRNMNSRTINKIKSCGVIVYNTPEEYKNMKIINYRWKIYEEFLKDKKDKYNLIFTADLRDVFFQKDIFKYYENYKPFLGVALEDGYLSNYYNKNWIINAYGEDIYKTLQNERIICVGTIWGSIDQFYQFSKIMNEILNSEWSLKKKVIEQSVCNYLIYHDKLFNECLIKSDNKDGYVMTIGMTNRTDIKFDSDNNLLNGNGKIAGVVHQYDRKEDIVKILINKFCPEIIFYRIYYKILEILPIFFVLIVIIIGVIFFCKKFLRKKTNKKKMSKKVNIKMETPNDLSSSRIDIFS